MTPFFHLVPRSLLADVLLLLIHPHLRLMSVLPEGHLQVSKLLHLPLCEHIVKTVSIVQ